MTFSEIELWPQQYFQRIAAGDCLKTVLKLIQGKFVSDKSGFHETFREASLKKRGHHVPGRPYAPSDDAVNRYSGKDHMLCKIHRHCPAREPEQSDFSPHA